MQITEPFFKSLSPKTKRTKLNIIEDYNRLVEVYIQEVEDFESLCGEMDGLVVAYERSSKATNILQTQVTALKERNLELEKTCPIDLFEHTQYAPIDFSGMHGLRPVKYSDLRTTVDIPFTYKGRFEGFASGVVLGYSEGKFTVLLMRCKCQPNKVGRLYTIRPEYCRPTVLFGSLYLWVFRAASRLSQFIHRCSVTM